MEKLKERRGEVVKKLLIVLLISMFLIGTASAELLTLKEKDKDIIAQRFPELIYNKGDILGGTATFKYCLPEDKYQVDLDFKLSTGDISSIKYGYYTTESRTYERDTLPCIKEGKPIFDGEEWITPCVAYTKENVTETKQVWNNGLPSEQKGHSRKRLL